MSADFFVTYVPDQSVSIHAANKHLRFLVPYKDYLHSAISTLIMLAVIERRKLTFKFVRRRHTLPVTENAHDVVITRWTGPNKGFVRSIACMSMKNLPAIPRFFI